MVDIQYPVNNCYICLQGEGVQTGVAMVLLRLHGCAVSCPWCDTKETWDFDEANQVDTLEQALGADPQYTYLTSSDIAAYIKSNYPSPKWVLVTGGEPAQYDLEPLVADLHAVGYKVALETSGTEIGHVKADFDWICVSPKINMPGRKTIKPEALAIADEIKHVVGTQKDIEKLDNLLLQMELKEDVQLCLQPVSLSPKATRLCIQTVQDRGWRLSLQTHKLIDLP